MKNKILLVNYDKRWGGGQEYLLTLLDNLISSSDYSIGHLLETHSISAKRFPERFSNSFQYQPIFCNRNNIGKLILIFREYNLIHIHREHDLWIGVIAKLINPKIKLVFSQHVLPTKKRLSLMFIDEFICNSQYTQKAFYLINKKTAKLIYPTCSLGSLNELQEKHLIKGSPALLMSGAFYKKQEELVEIFSLVKKELPKATLYFIGPSSTELAHNRLLEAIKTSNNEDSIFIMSPTDRQNYLSFLSSADLFVYAFTKEAFGLAVLEAVLMNKPIVAYKGGGVTEILDKYSQAILIEEGNKELFSKAVVDLYKKQEKVQIKTPELQEHFSLEHFVNNHLEIYASLLK